MPHNLATLDRLMAETDARFVGLVFDTGHAFCGGANTPGALSALLVSFFIAMNKRYAGDSDSLMVTALELGTGVLLLPLSVRWSFHCSAQDVRCMLHDPRGSVAPYLARCMLHVACVATLCGRFRPPSAHAGTIAAERGMAALRAAASTVC